ncbi:MAG TPA: hypothetical protein VNE84_03315 [Candidatus Limnocylindria bacterium]|nr:hypothetical protein [Candidatus Limnocylindria bacterium]
MKKTTPRVKTEMPARAKATTLLTTAKALPLWRMTIEIKRGVALLARTATIPLERLAAPPTTVKRRAQPIPALVQQEQLRRKFLRQTQGLAGQSGG